MSPSMNVNPLNVRRTSTVLKPDQSRVLLRPFNPGGSERVGSIIARIMSLPEDRVGPLLNEISAEFSQRHKHVRRIFLERFEQVRETRISPNSGDFSSAPISWPNTRLNPLPYSIPPSFRILNSRIFRAAPCGLSSACAPRGKVTFPPSRFEPVSSIRINGSKSSLPPAFSLSPARSQTPCMRRRCSNANSRNWD